MLGPFCKERYRFAAKALFTTKRITANAKRECLFLPREELLQIANVNIPFANKRTAADNKREYPGINKNNIK